MTAINEHTGKPFIVKPVIKINNDIYNYCKSKGTVVINSFGLPEKKSFINYLGDTCIVDSNEIAESSITIPVDPSLISMKYIIEKVKEDFIFKLAITDPKTGDTLQIDSAHFEVPSGVSLDSDNNANVTIKGSEAYFI